MLRPWTGVCVHCGRYAQGWPLFQLVGYIPEVNRGDTVVVLAVVGATPVVTSSGVVPSRDPFQVGQLEWRTLDELVGAVMDMQR
jgi:hypothetical protein